MAVCVNSVTKRQHKSGKSRHVAQATKSPLRSSASGLRRNSKMTTIIKKALHGDDTALPVLGQQ
jgi:hypothetical protein